MLYPTDATPVEVAYLVSEIYFNCDFVFLDIMYVSTSCSDFFFAY